MMRGKLAKQLRKTAKLADWPKETTYTRDERTGAVLLAQCERWMIKVLKRINRKGYHNYMQKGEML